MSQQAHATLVQLALLGQGCEGGPHSGSAVPRSKTFGLPPVKVDLLDGGPNPILPSAEVEEGALIAQDGGRVDGTSNKAG
eukprot:905067-Alexandrium_andersonii.AAC.1